MLADSLGAGRMYLNPYVTDFYESRVQVREGGTDNSAAEQVSQRCFM